MSKQDDFARYTVRIPPAIYASVEAAAARNNRSINGEIIARIEGGAAELRDIAALTAMQSILTTEIGAAADKQAVAVEAFHYADAFMAARSGASS